MDWVLNDSKYGAYSSGKLSIGKYGDFVTSPSLGPEFAKLLAIQISDWLIQLNNIRKDNRPITLVEVGPGEGHLALDLINALVEICPEILPLLELVLIEPNEGMAAKQKQLLKSNLNVPVCWTTLDQLAESPVFGIMLAHEVLDAFPVERLIYDEEKKSLFRQGVKIINNSSDPKVCFNKMPLSSSLRSSLEEVQNFCGFNIPPDDVSDGWCTEWHIDINPWLEKVSKAFSFGNLLIIDYALEAKRYYTASRPSGTLLAYKGQRSSSKLLDQPGECDLTSHICLELLQFYAKKHGIQFLGESRQGQALLALGLAKELHALQSLPNHKLSLALTRRENLLRLVDPFGLGEFRWLIFSINNNNKSFNRSINLTNKFLEEPSN